MKQYDLINSVTRDFVSKNYIECSFLKGSFGRRREDEYSNIDYYLILNQEYEDDFYNEYNNIFSKYGKIIYSKNEDNVKITMIYQEDNVINSLNVIFIMHIISKENIIIDDDILALYDPYKYCDNIKINTEYTSKEIGEKIDKIALDTLEFIRFSNRNDLGIMLSIVSRMEQNYVSIIRYYKDKTRSRLDKKELLAYLDKNERIKYIEIIKSFKVDTLKNCVIKMMDDLSNIITRLDINVASNFDYDFFMYMLGKIKK